MEPSVGKSAAMWVATAVTWGQRMDPHDRGPMGQMCESTTQIDTLDPGWVSAAENSGNTREGPVTKTEDREPCVNKIRSIDVDLRRVKLGRALPLAQGRVHCGRPDRSLGRAWRW